MAVLFMFNLFCRLSRSGLWSHRALSWPSCNGSHRPGINVFALRLAWHVIDAPVGFHDVVSGVV